MPKKRREFIKNIGILSAGICVSPYFGCGDKVDPQKDNGNSSSPSPNPDPISSFQKYNFNVNSPPNEKALFEIVSGVSDSEGVLRFSSSFGSDSFFVSNKWGTEKLPNIKGTCFIHKTDKTKKIVYVEDENNKYFSDFSFPLYGGTKSGSIITMNKIIDGLGIRGTWVKKLDESLPSWDWEKIDDRPGSIYLGDWTFDEIKNFNTTLKKGSLVITTVTPNPISAKAYAIFSASGQVLDGIDYAIDIINYVSPGTIDRNKTYAWYLPISPVPFVSIFEPAAGLIKYRAENIKDFFPSAIGNSWRYSLGDSLYELQIKGLRNVKGKNLFISKGVDGMEEYFGYYGDKLNHYGFNLSGIGDVFFDPPITFGDSDIAIGKTYASSSKVVCESYPDLTGNIQEVFSYEDREVIAPRNKPYGGCFKVKEQISLQVSRGGNTVSDNSTAYHWFAKNIGKVRSELNGSILELYDYDFQHLKNSEIIKELEINISIASKVSEAIKKLI